MEMDHPRAYEQSLQKQQKDEEREKRDKEFLEKAIERPDLVKRFNDFDLRK
jgi:hypothetical protein